jgi:hypothetical protein
MAKIFLDILLILLFIAVGGLQVYVLYRIKDLKSSYTEFMNSQNEFIKYIEKARQSLMLVNSQAVDVLPELRKNIEESETLMQDFSFVLARANKKIEVLQDMSNLTPREIVESENIKQQPAQQEQDVVARVETPMGAYQTAQNSQMNNSQGEFSDDPILSRLEQLEQADKQEDTDFLKSDNKRAQYQQDLIEKALKEIL